MHEAILPIQTEYQRDVGHEYDRVGKRQANNKLVQVNELLLALKVAAQAVFRVHERQVERAAKREEKNQETHAPGDRASANAHRFEGRVHEDEALDRQRQRHVHRRGQEHVGHDDDAVDVDLVDERGLREQLANLLERDHGQSAQVAHAQHGQVRVGALVELRLEQHYQVENVEEDAHADYDVDEHVDEVDEGAIAAACVRVGRVRVKRAVHHLVRIVRVLIVHALVRIDVMTRLWNRKHYVRN